MNILKEFQYKKIKFQYKRPTQCPFCNTAISLDPVHEAVIPYENDIGVLYVVTECVACRTPFISVYPYSDNPCLENHFDYPKNYKATVFDKFICDYFFDFVEIYNESEKAENLGLYNICGAGYRKALEFLVKQYTIKKLPANQSDIEKETLSQTIDRLPAGNIRKAAKKASWLGNDQVHYKIKYTDRDVSDLKKFISATIHWILMEEIVEEEL